MSVRRPMPPLDDAQLAQAQAMRAFFHQHLPDALPFIKDLAEAGLFAGWRDVDRVRLATDPPWTERLGVMARGNGYEFCSK